jgi:hypothetical protein
MQQAQQQQVEEQTQEQQQWQQWQQWQSQWQWQHSAGVAANQLQERFEQLEQQFRSSLWWMEYGSDLSALLSSNSRHSRERWVKGKGQESTGRATGLARVDRQSDGERHEFSSGDVERQLADGAPSTGSDDRA